MIAWRESLDLVCRTRGTCLRWFSFDSAGRWWGGRCVRGCGGDDCQWLVRPTVQRFARGTTPPERDEGGDMLARTKPFVPVEPVPLPDPPSGPVHVPQGRVR
jgi:hypothetical protein